MVVGRCNLFRKMLKARTSHFIIKRNGRRGFRDCRRRRRVSCWWKMEGKARVNGVRPTFARLMSVPLMPAITTVGVVVMQFIFQFATVYFNQV